MPWPAWFSTTEAKEGTAYIRTFQFPGVIAQHKPRGQAWKYDQQWTTYCPNRKLTYKCLDRLRPCDKPHASAKEVEDEFWSIMDAAKSAKLNPPTSFADMWLSVYRQPMPRISILAAFNGRSFGGWQEARRRGEIAGKVYEYDINKAYRWAAMRGLPDLRTAFPTYDFTLPHAVYLVRVPVGIIPYKRVPFSHVHMVTSEERDALGLLNVKCDILYGVGFSQVVSLAESFEAVDKLFPSKIASRVSRAFWGLWNTRHGPEAVSWAHGEKIRIMRNPWYNPIWALFVTSRVKLRILPWLKYCVHIHVDNILSTEQMPTGDQYGDWKHVNTYERLWIRTQGTWGTGPYTLRHSGIGSLALYNTPPPR